MSRFPRRGFLFFLALALSASPGAAAAAQTISLIYTTNVIGEIEPCGCSVRLGGLPRRANLLEELRAKGEPAILLDTGDHFFKDVTPPPVEMPQHARKAEILADGLRALGCDVMCPGEADFAQGLPGLKKLAERAGVTLICANLRAGNDRPFAATAIREVGGVKVGFLGLLKTTRNLPEDGGKALLVEDTIPAATSAVAGLKEADVIVALTHQGLKDDRTLAERVPGIDLIIGGHSREANGAGTTVGRTLIVQAGYQAKWVGLVKLAVTPRSGATPPTVTQVDARQIEVHPSRTPEWFWLRITEEYKAWVTRLNQRDIVDPRPTTNIYWGAELCGQCHQQQDAFWKKSRHGHAYATLVSKGKQHDVECLACHSLAFAETRNRPELKSVSDVTGLENVQCESCHGAGSSHNQPQIRSLATQESTCRKCHDPKNSAHFEFKTWLPRMTCPKTR